MKEPRNPQGEPKPLLTPKHTVDIELDWPAPYTNEELATIKGFLDSGAGVPTLRAIVIAARKYLVGRPATLRLLSGHENVAANVSALRKAATDLAGAIKRRLGPRTMRAIGNEAIVTAFEAMRAATALQISLTPGPAPHTRRRGRIPDFDRDILISTLDSIFSRWPSPNRRGRPDFLRSCLKPLGISFTPEQADRLEQQLRRARQRHAKRAKPQSRPHTSPTE